MFETKTWGDISRLRYGKALSGYRTSGSGTVPVFGTNGRTGFTDQALVEGSGLIIGRKGAYRGVHFSDGPFWVIDTAYYLEPADQVDLRWAYYSLLLADINGLDSGSAIPSTTRESFYSLPVRVPSIESQGAIAEVLGALDDKIAANTKLADIARSAAIVNLATVHEMVPLGAMAALVKSSVDPSSLTDATVAHFSLPAFDDGRVPVLESPTGIQSQKFLVDAPSVLLSKLNPRFPRVWHLGRLPSQRSLASTEFLVLQPTHSSASVLWAAISQPAFASLLDAKAAGTSGSHQRVRPDDALATPVADVRGLDGATAAKVGGLVELADSLVQENQGLATLRDTLLPQLLSGKLRVRDAERTLIEVL